MVDKYFLEELTDNLKHPGDKINVGGVMVATPDFNYGAKLKKILEAAANLV